MNKLRFEMRTIKYIFCIFIILGSALSLYCQDNINKLESTQVVSGDNDELNLGYSYLGKSEYQNAANVFEKYIIKHPSDTKIYLQLGYIYYNLSNYEKALNYFEYVESVSKNPDEIDKSNLSQYYVTDLITLNSQKSLNIYFYNVYDSYYKNYVTNLVGHINLKISKNTSSGVYIDSYLDSKSNPDNILNDRYFEGGGFFRIKLTDYAGFELRAGYVREIDYNKSSFNFKPILSLGKILGNPAIYYGSKNSRSDYFYFDVFSTGLYDYKFRNLFGQLQMKEVLRHMTGGFSYLEFYLTQRLLADSKQLDYNNYSEIGFGLSFKPDLINFPVIFLEMTNKMYLISPEGLYLQGPLKNAFQVKAGLLINLNTKL